METTARLSPTEPAVIEQGPLTSALGNLDEVIDLVRLAAVMQRLTTRTVGV